MFGLDAYFEFFPEGIVYFWVTNNTSCLQMWVLERCSGMHFTRNNLVAWMAPVVDTFLMLLIHYKHALDRKFIDKFIQLKHQLLVFSRNKINFVKHICVLHDNTIDHSNSHNSFLKNTNGCI